MVDCYLLDLAKINKEQRRAIIEYVTKVKKVTPKMLGVKPNYIYMVRLGKERAGDGLLCQALKYMTEEELIMILNDVPWLILSDLIKNLIENCLEDCVRNCITKQLAKQP
jgi:hypothetical protein